MGMAYNILCVSVLGVFLIDLFNKNTINLVNTVEERNPDSIGEGGYFLYFMGLILTLMTDTYYAKTFFQIVGKRTMGADAIWYASDEDQKFRRINRITARLNIFFYVLTTLVIYLISKNL